MIETKDKTIGDSVYSVTQMPGLTALRMQSKLLKLVGPSFAQMVASAGSKSLDSGLASAASLLFNQLDPDTFENLVKDLLKGVRKDGKEIDKNILNMDFAGNLNELFQVLQYVIEVNYADFFQDGGILKVLIDLMKKEEEPTPPGLTTS